MKKFYLIILLQSVFVLNSSAQFEGLYQFSHAYFRSDPFAGQFSAFLQHLLKDPAIANKQSRLKTDTSFFRFTGNYVNYNPFFFKPTRIEVALQEIRAQYLDSLPAGDTILLYQVTAYAEASEKGLKEVKKEAEKIHRTYRKRFFDSNFSEFKEGEAITGTMYNYFVPMHGVAPLSVAWGTIDNNQPILNITLRLKTSDNFATLPVPLYHP